MKYFDHNASSSMDERVLEAMLPYLSQHYGNPSSLHRYGRITRTAIDVARQQVAALVNARPEQVIFTGSGTEANNLAIKGTLAYFAQHNQTIHAGLSVIEHPSVLAQLPFLQSQGWAVELLPVSTEGVLCFDALSDFLAKSPQLFSVMAANNETGVLQDLSRLGRLAREHNALFHTDATQAAGKIHLDFPADQVHLMTLSAHKIHGPKGIGALIVDDTVHLASLLHGGGHESGRRAGTENVAAIVGFGAAAELAQKQLNKQTTRIKGLRDRLEKRLRSSLEKITVFSHQAPRLPNTSCFSVPGLHGEALVMQLDQQGFAVSSGSACESDVDQPSHVLQAMGITDDISLGAIRVSLGRGNHGTEIQALTDTIINIASTAQQYG